MSTVPKQLENITLPPPALHEPEWFAVHTRSRHEKKVEAELRGKGIETFLPVMSQTRQWSDRKMKLEFPLFPCYLFVRIALSPMSHISVLQTNGVVTLLGVNGRPSPIPEHQVESTRTLVTNKVPFEQHPFLKVGQRVRVRGGSLDGVEGVLLATGNDRKLVLSVDLIKQSLAVSLDGYEVEPV